jgi:hypothetical protein
MHFEKQYQKLVFMQWYPKKQEISHEFFFLHLALILLLCLNLCPKGDIGCEGEGANSSQEAS